MLLYRTLRAADAVAASYGVRNGGIELTRNELDSAILRLAALPLPGADEEGALTFLDYAAADGAARRHDEAQWRRQLLATREAARRTLLLSPSRADVSLALAEVEYLLHAPRQAVEAPLELSFASAPRELWIVKRRIGLGLRLAPDASPRLEKHIESDIRILGEPFRSLDNYWVLARAALRAGPAAIALVRQILARGHPWPFQFFNQDLDRLSARKPAAAH
ncbi:MAG TPA: hypothetical protein VGR91_12720 [Stellaceae bacterium]|nr:hypothetical protein [Stellaceae bacterium]